MSVWDSAKMMGWKRSEMIVKEFKHQVFEPDQTIVAEGEKGDIFYIILSGKLRVAWMNKICFFNRSYDEGEAGLYKRNMDPLKRDMDLLTVMRIGKSFGEMGLSGRQVHAATIKAVTKVEVMSLRRKDYDYFVREMKIVERRENSHLLRLECRLFEKWSRAKVEKLSECCKRLNFEANSYIFHQVFVKLEIKCNFIV
jgi:CRP-like cAMP-binding protein